YFDCLRQLPVRFPDSCAATDNQEIRLRRAPLVVCLLDIAVSFQFTHRIASPQEPAACLCLRILHNRVSEIQRAIRLRRSEICFSRTSAVSSIISERNSGLPDTCPGFTPGTESKNDS